MPLGILHLKQAKDLRKIDNVMRIFMQVGQNWPLGALTYRIFTKISYKIVGKYLRPK